MFVAFSLCFPLSWINKQRTMQNIQNWSIKQETKHPLIFSFFTWFFRFMCSRFGTVRIRFLLSKGDSDDEDSFGSSRKCHQNDVINCIKLPMNQRSAQNNRRTKPAAAIWVVLGGYGNILFKHVVINPTARSCDLVGTTDELWRTRM